jgi:hypothetical protein
MLSQVLPLQVQNGTSLNWRCHLDGVYRLIMLRGGFSAVAGVRSLYPLLMSFWSYVTPHISVSLLHSH